MKFEPALTNYNSNYRRYVVHHVPKVHHSSTPKKMTEANLRNITASEETTSSADNRIRIILDPQAGICGGVRRAIRFAEKELKRESNRQVYVLGDIIHNEREVERLEAAGLKTLHVDELEQWAEDEKAGDPRDVVLVRAHGEPPETFDQLKRLNVRTVNGTCPVVTRSQELAQEYHQKGYQIAIVGKHKHPEIVSIIGHTQNHGIIIQFDEDTEKLNPDRPTLVMAQTTIDPKQFGVMVAKILQRVKEVEVSETICKFVIRRHLNLPRFARNADVILVVGGHKSSNTKMLHATCKAINPRCYHVVDVKEIDRAWFDGARAIGVTGSASTPSWLLEEFVKALEKWIEAGWPRVEASN